MKLFPRTFTLFVIPVVCVDMNIHNLDCIFKPQRIALYGVTENPKSVAGTVLRNVVGSGFRGAVYPINPSCESVLGVHCYPDLAHLPRLPELAVVCAPAPQVPAIVRECGEAGVLGLIIISAGFRETCLEIARSWGIRRVVAETTSDNVRMIALFQERGFEVTPEEQGLVTVAKDLA